MRNSEKMTDRVIKERQTEKMKERQSNKEKKRERETERQSNKERERERENEIWVQGEKFSIVFEDQTRR